MSFVSVNIESPTDSPVKLTRRALAKQRTRERVLSAARRLFTERGYEGATIRDIAQAAGMSTGAVFASFSDKSELFDEILTADYEVIYAQMVQAARTAGTVDEACWACSASPTASTSTSCRCCAPASRCRGPAPKPPSVVLAPTSSTSSA
jgi:AcrR family transcriptional regulator